MSLVRLIPIEGRMAKALGESPDAFSALCGASVGESAETLAEILGMTYGNSPWGGYLAVDKERNEIIGTCAFKGPPDGEGVVEIAYFSFPPFEGQGYATAMARELIAIAGADPGSPTVIAHTLPESNASNHILQKIGMRFAGDVIDPEDGPVWRWQL